MTEDIKPTKKKDVILETLLELSHNTKLNAVIPLLSEYTVYENMGMEQYEILDMMKKRYAEKK